MFVKHLTGHGEGSPGQRQAPTGNCDLLKNVRVCLFTKLDGIGEKCCQACSPVFHCNMWECTAQRLCCWSVLGGSRRLHNHDSLLRAADLPACDNFKQRLLDLKICWRQKRCKRQSRANTLQVHEVHRPTQTKKPSHRNLKVHCTG
jgi:hypothetical protein